MKTMTMVVGASLAFAKGLFTRGTDAFGPDEIQKVFGVNLTPEQVPPIPFTEAELNRARELGMYLILQVNTNKDDHPLTMQAIHDQFGNKLGAGKLLYDTGWYAAEEPFYTTDTPRLGWALISREVIPGSAGVDYLDQTQVLADYLVNEVYKGEKLSAEYQAAVDEWDSRKVGLGKIRNTDWVKCAEGLVSLKLNMLFRERPVEVLYGLVSQHEVNRERLLNKTYAWTNQRSLLGGVVYVGDCAPGGVGVDYDDPGYSDSGRGVRFFHSGV